MMECITKRGAGTTGMRTSQHVDHFDCTPGGLSTVEKSFRFAILQDVMSKPEVNAFHDAAPAAMSFTQAMTNCSVPALPYPDMQDLCCVCARLRSST